jgi:mannosyltransferase OCH1-like enzyme
MNQNKMDPTNPSEWTEKTPPEYLFTRVEMNFCFIFHVLVLLCLESLFLQFVLCMFGLSKYGGIYIDSDIIV